MFVAEAAVSSFLTVVVEKLVSAPLLDYARRQKVEPTLQQWKTTLLDIEAVLVDAEQRQIRDEAVTSWLDDLKSVAYDMEDVLDEFNTESNRRLLMAEGPQTSTSKVRKLIPSCCAYFDPTDLMFNRKIGEKIEKITEELNAIVNRKSNFRLMEVVGGLSFGSEERLQTTSLVDESTIFGRDRWKDDIIQLLLSEKATTSNEVSVVPIVGMGGVGKTTLAQIIYNDERVKGHFHMRIWVCVSDQFDVISITKAILESATQRSSDLKNLEPLQNSLKNELSGKRYFLVLDDVWNEKPQNWDALKAPFGAGAQGSAIIVTTRSEEVAAIMRTTSSSHRLEMLSYQDCWLLFEKLVLANMNSNVRQKLEPIGKEIVRKCGGLPLAVKTLGGLLRSKGDENAWNRVLNSEIWELNEQSGILPALNLSYHYLPTILKRCFAYCSIFPKDYQFEKEKLVLLWMAEGLLDGSKTEESMEAFGNICFENLVSKCFFQRSSDDESVFLMHDLIHDLAQFVAGKFCSRLEDEKPNQLSDRTRHCSYSFGYYLQVTKKFSPFYGASNLRTFLQLHNYYIITPLSEKITHVLLPTLKCLRVLSLSHYAIVDLPPSIENLKHLRYLDLSRTKISGLPESITNLFNLQTLMLSNCWQLKHLPLKMEKLINLRHLDTIGTGLEEMPGGMNRLKNLQTLTAFVVGRDRGARIRELRDMPDLGGTLSIFKLQNVVNAVDALEVNLKGKTRLDGLVLRGGLDGGAVDPQKETSVLENLQPPMNLKHLSIKYYCGAKFPNWLGEHSLAKMVSINLHNCKNCSSLPPLGQLQSLKKLFLKGIDGVQRLGQEFYGNRPFSLKPFRSLETLRFGEMAEWEEWVCTGVDFPRLKELYIEECAKLKGELPKHLPLLAKLEIRKCRQLVCHLPMAPSICELKLDECDDAVVISVCELTSITSLEVRNICEVPVELGQLHSLVELTIDEYREVKELPPSLHNLTSLKRLEIYQCENLLSLPEMGLPNKLETLAIRDCDRLESVPEGMFQNNNGLQHLSIKSCGSLTSFPIITSLRRLEIWGCKKMELRLGEDMMHSHYASLTYLSIGGSCDHLTSFPLALFTKLETLAIMRCENLHSLVIPDRLHHVELTSLQEIRIVSCPSLVSFPQGGLPTPNLKSLQIWICKKLKSLPQQMGTLLTSLEKLSLLFCPEIEYLFGEGGLPNSLSQLEIWKCKKLMGCRKEWGLQRLPSLRNLRIGGVVGEEERLESFPEEGLLPSALTHLGIGPFQNLKRLDSKGLQHLTSLETLRIWKCEKLKHLPKQGLPSSISRLEMEGCPLLKKRYSKREKGKGWPNISHIPCVIFDSIEDSKEVILS